MEVEIVSLFDQVPRPSIKSESTFVAKVVSINVSSKGMEIILADNHSRYKYFISMDNWNNFMANVNCNDTNSLLNKIVEIHQLDRIDGSKEIIFHEFKPIDSKNLIDLTCYKFEHWYGVV